MITVIFFLFGLIIGSFLNVIVYRLNVAESLLGRSHCPHCKKKIRWYDNIPLLSFVVLKGECRDCQKKISWQYPLVELLTGIIFALVGYSFFSSFDPASWLATFHYLFLFSLLLVIFVYDWKFMEIPMIVFWIAVFWALSYALFSDWQNFSPALGFLDLSVISGIIGGLCAFLFFFILVSVSKEKWMGMGDAYLAFLVGFIAGFPDVVFVLILSFFIGSIYSIILLALKKKTLKSQVPFAPFLVSAVFILIFIYQFFPQLKYYFLF